jgi:hypothetical protein
MFKNWAQPVVSKKWAYIATVTNWIAKHTRFVLFGNFQHRAWERAVGSK